MTTENGKKRKAPERVKIATSEYEYVNSKDEKTKKEFGLYRDKYQYILVRKGCSENYYYSNFLSMIKDLFSECFKLGINKIELGHIQEVVANANNTIDRFYSAVDADIKRLEAELAEAKEEVRVLKGRNRKGTNQINAA